MFAMLRDAAKNFLCGHLPFERDVHFYKLFAFHFYADGARLRNEIQLRNAVFHLRGKHVYRGDFKRTLFSVHNVQVAVIQIADVARFDPSNAVATHQTIFK